MKHIIIADDSSTARMFIRRCLEIVVSQEAEYSEAENGQGVLDILEKRPADLIVTDLNMPVMNGADLLKRIKSSPKKHYIPVIVITSAANPEKEQELEQLGALAILGKPISPAVVMPVISDLFGEEEEPL